MGSYDGVTVVDGNTAYLSRDYNMYSYTVAEDKWTKLPPCKFKQFGLAVVNRKLTSIGGRYGGWFSDFQPTNILLSFSGSTWDKVLPPMPTERWSPAAATTPTHLVVAGGQKEVTEILGDSLPTVEVLSIDNLQWSTASNLLKALRLPQMTLCGGSFYLSEYKIFY